MSKFKSLLDTVKGREPEPEPEKPPQDSDVNHKKPVVRQEPIVEAQPEPKRGRPKGKRSDPDYEQVTAYIRKDTHASIKIALLQEGQKREFSELVQELLEQWVKSRT